MKLCPSGHENTDDARRCAVCLRRFSAPPPRLELAGLPPGPVSVRPGSTSTVTAGVVLRGGEPTTCMIELTGSAAAWTKVRPASLALIPDEVQQVVLDIGVPADSGEGGSIVGVVARGVEDGRPEVRGEVLLEVVAPAAPAAGPRPTTRDPEADAVTAVRPPSPGPFPEPVAPVEPRSPSRPRPPARRRAAVLVLLGSALVVSVALVGISLAWWGGDRQGGDEDGGTATSLTPAQAFALSTDEARAVLADQRSTDASRVGALVAEPGALVQLSSKCASFTKADLDGSEGIGIPDGDPERYPAGMGNNGILAFHVAARERFGDTVLLTDGSGLGRKPCPEGDPVWLTVMTPDDGLPASVGAALCTCKSLGLPFGECGAAPTDGGKPVYWTKKNQDKACT